MRICDITGKGKQYGSSVSFSQRHTKKVWKPNLQTKTVVIDGKKTKLKLSAQAIRTLKKQGLLTTGSGTDSKLKQKATDAPRQQAE
jgi:large subunit ribosomal protein L28